ncbi:FAD/NAD(P)-binding protein [Sabulicella rubraurantiaca]|uniref:FAD/NAD(P)-binding protein n=1 Tax=Sabulicella rubraurantiaca TaxID=2811429 RepID=UPI001A96C6FD|nr:NAD(P)/FAD-dependent oxidoreductase [Sabulicella rubraurantiaca]
MDHAAHPAPPPGLLALERRVAADLEALMLPPKPWVPRLERDGEAVLDVAVVGAGMNGIAAAGSLIFKGIGHVAVLDENPPGLEGPWVAWARMDTLRSPKTLPGPCFGIPSLTFRAWCTAAQGEAAWEALYKIPNAVWQDYLSWLQRVLALPVRHRTKVARIRPEDGVLRLLLADGTSLLARRVVLATGRAGAGGLALPEVVDRSLWPNLAAHANAPIDFERLRGKRVAVIGGGASAWDNAATALEGGAKEATLYIRRPHLPQINKGRGSAGPGFQLGWGDLDDASRWLLVTYMYDNQSPPPHETVHRALRLPGFRIHLDTPTLATRREGGEVVLTLGGAEPREVRADFLIAGTGFRVDLDHVPELAELAPHIARWGDCYTPPEDLRRPEMEAFPYLGRAFELTPKGGAAPPDLARIHLLSYGAHASHGGIASDIPGVVAASERLANGIAAHFFREEQEAVRAELAAFDEPELESTPFFIPRG